LVLLSTVGHREISLAAVPELADAVSPVYHRACSPHAGDNHQAASGSARPPGQP